MGVYWGLGFPWEMGIIRRHTVGGWIWIWMNSDEKKEILSIVTPVSKFHQNLHPMSSPGYIIDKIIFNLILTGASFTGAN